MKEHHVCVSPPWSLSQFSSLLPAVLSNKDQKAPHLKKQMQLKITKHILKGKREQNKLLFSKFLHQYFLHIQGQLTN